MNRSTRRCSISSGSRRRTGATGIDKHPIKYKEDTADLYAWYYDTQACLMFGGSAWSQWNRMFQDEIADNQSPDGSWPPCGGKAAGAEMLRRPDGAGPYYRTCLCIL